MKENITIEAGVVPKSLLLLLWVRAMETQKAHPELVDPAALAVLERLEDDLAAKTADLDELSQIAWIRRSLVMDRIIRAFIQNHPQGTIVNIGSGLDTTFDRVDNGSLLWYELDLPEVLEIRGKLIPAGPRRRHLSASFLEEDWLDEIEVQDNVLFMAAGVFCYHEEEEMQSFFLRLAERFPGAEILFDAVAARSVVVSNKKANNSHSEERRRLKWGVKTKDEFPYWDKRLKVAGTHFYFRKINLRHRLRNILMGFLSDVLKVQYVIHLKITTQ